MKLSESTLWLEKCFVHEFTIRYFLQKQLVKLFSCSWPVWFAGYLRTTQFFISVLRCSRFCGYYSLRWCESYSSILQTLTVSIKCCGRSLLCRCVHLYTCAFYRVKVESAASPDDVATFYSSRGIDENVCDMKFNVCSFKREREIWLPACSTGSSKRLCKWLFRFGISALSFHMRVFCITKMQGITRILVISTCRSYFASTTSWPLLLLWDMVQSDPIFFLVVRQDLESNPLPLPRRYLCIDYGREGEEITCSRKSLCINPRAGDRLASDKA